MLLSALSLPFLSVLPSARKPLQSQSQSVSLVAESSQHSVQGLGRPSVLALQRQGTGTAKTPNLWSQFLEEREQHVYKFRLIIQLLELIHFAELLLSVKVQSFSLRSDSVIA